MAEEKKGANKFTSAADKFFGEVAEQLEESVSLKDIQGIQRATAVADLIYKVNQSLKLMKEEKKAKLGEAEKDDGRSYIDRQADKKRTASLNGATT